MILPHLCFKWICGLAKTKDSSPEENHSESHRAEKQTDCGFVQNAF